jgi:dolichol-phosphate mannosyltransferase
MTVPSVSLIIPTYNEYENLVPLLDSVREVMSGREFEIVVVDDDSPDRTWQLAESYAAAHREVRVIRRMNARGLSSAVVEGFENANGCLLAVMDGDHSHDPTLLPRLVDAVLQGADLAAGSRRVAGGGAAKWPWHRKRTSDAATWLARFWLHVPLLDPMSGYFVVRREVFESVRGSLLKRGYKILLEIVCRAGDLKIVELPYIFRDRHQGISKLNAGVAREFIQSLWDLRDTRKLRRG